MSRLLNILGCKHPIIQGPIGALNTPKLIAEISEAGAFGMLAMGFVYDPEEAKKLVGKVRELTDKPFGANLMIMNPANETILKVLKDAGVKTVTTSAGSPSKIFPTIHDLGMKGLHVLLSVSHAVKAYDAGVDGIVISGNESGGLRSLGSESSTMVLVPLVCDHVNVPVVAAGGIADSRGYRAALALGAEGIQVGTRFIATEESDAPKEWKDAIVECGDGGTTLVPIGKMSMRSIVNPKLQRLMTEPGSNLAEEYNMMDAQKAWTGGDFDLFPAGSGEVAALVNDVKPAREIIGEMVSEG